MAFHYKSSIVLLARVVAVVEMFKNVMFCKETMALTIFQIAIKCTLHAAMPLHR